MATYLVFLEPSEGFETVSHRADAALTEVGIAVSPSVVFDQLNGFAVELTEAQADALAALSQVASVEPDAPLSLGIFLPSEEQLTGFVLTADTGVAAMPVYSNTIAATGETLPYGVRAVWRGEDISKRGNFAADAYAFVIDSGVLATTGDLNFATDATWHKSWIAGETPFTDGNGHGTHVSGTIAALANGKGVVGVAPGARIVSLKVFNSSGGGASNATVIDAINHATGVINGNSLDKQKVVVNLSLGGGFSTSLDTAIKASANQGIRFSVAAGNDGGDADNKSPAAAGDHPNIYTVSAVDANYRMASFSNWDKLTDADTVDDVDFAAPGVAVVSFYKEGKLAALNGTSMAAPHVAGLLITGGVVAGELVIPYYAGTADSFAWAAPPAVKPPFVPPPLESSPMAPVEGLAIGNYLTLKNAKGVVHRFQNFHIGVSSSFEGASYTFLPFGFSGISINRTGDNTEASLVFPNNDLSRNWALQAVTERWIGIVYVMLLNPDNTSTGERLNQCVGQIASGDWDETAVKLNLNTVLDAVGSDVPLRRLTQSLVGALPITSNVRLR